jgi:hypothetical protein
MSKSFIDFIVDAQTDASLTPNLLTKNTAKDLAAFFSSRGYTVSINDCQKLIDVKQSTFATGTSVRSGDPITMY